MNRKVLGLLVVVSTLLLSFVLVSSHAAQAAPPGPNYRPVDVGPQLRDKGPSDVPLYLDGFEQEYAAAQAAAADPPQLYVEGDVITAIWYDDTQGLFLADYEVRAIGEHIEVWVMTDLNFPDGDPRNPVLVTDEQINYLVQEFDNNIYPTMINFFGPPDFHDGSNAALPFDYYDPEGRTIAMISNIGDENYHDPDYPLYIAGFYWGAVFELYLDRNVISIDAYDWANRVGPDAAIPNLYEGVFAHEYQHLLHDDYDSDEENWINEGLSDWAERLVGYGIPESHVEAVAAAPENSLVLWGDQGDLEILTDYGLGYLFQEQLAQDYGTEFNKQLFLNSANGISGVNDVLSSFGSGETFGDVYHEFATNLYTTGAFTLPALTDFQIDVGHPGQPNPEAYASPGAPPWGSDYHLLWGYERIGNLKFNGMQFNPTAWTSDGDVLYGGMGDLVDNYLIAAADLTGVTGATLNFDTMFDIEFAWDYGFVQVSTDGGQTWISLSNADTCSDLASGAHPTVANNVPGFTGVSGFGCNDPYAVSPYPDAQWISTSFDLSAYDGQQILVAFRYVTDWAFNEAGWYVDNVNIAGVFSADGSSTDAFMSLNEVLGIENAFTVQLIGESIRAGKPEYEVQTILSGSHMSDWTSVRQMFDNYRQLVMVVTYDAREGDSSYADYSVEIENQGGRAANKNK